MMVVIGGVGGVKAEKRKTTLALKQCSFWALKSELNWHVHIYVATLHLPLMEIMIMNLRHDG